MLERQRGDTIIEVLLAVTIFSLVAVGARVIMNQGTNAAQRALEITQVRHQIDAQAEALRAAQQAHAVASNPDASTWSEIADPSESTIPFNSDAAGSACPENVNDISTSFIMDARTGTKADGQWFNSINAIDAPPYAKVEYDGGLKAHGIWIERNYENGGAAPDAYDFTIKACWYAAGLSRPLQMDTLVRLYDPS